MGDLAAILNSPAIHASRPRPSHPKGWEPGVEERGDGTATAVSTPVGIEDGDDDPSNTSLPSDEELIRGWNMDPAVWKILGKVNVRRWQTYDERWLRYFKADLVLRDRTNIDIDALCSKIGRRKPRQCNRLDTAAGTHALVVSLADWQAGKVDNDGVQGLMDRLVNLVGQVQDRIRDLKRMGVNISIIYVCGLGDLQEGCSQHYAQQAFRTQLNVREQRVLVRWAIDSLLDAWSNICQVSVMVVGGNHGEERVDGKSYTDFGDNRDVAVFEDVRFAYERNPERYGNVSFFLPNDDLTLTFEHEGVVVGLAHGHQAGFTSGADPAKKIENWWRGMMAGRQSVGDADILITGHYHHFWARTIGKRTHFGCPALEGGSDWFRNTAGVQSAPGTLTFVLSGNGWSGLEIL